MIKADSKLFGIFGIIRINSAFHLSSGGIYYSLHFYHYELSAYFYNDFIVFGDSIVVHFVTFSETTDTKCSEGQLSEGVLHN